MYAKSKTIFVLCSVKRGRGRGLYVLAKSIGSCQLAQSVQADMSLNFSLFLISMQVKDNSDASFSLLFDNLDLCRIRN